MSYDNPSEASIEIISRQEYFHSKALAEPYLKLSLHTASIIKLQEIFLLPNDKTALISDMLLLITNLVFVLIRFISEVMIMQYQ